MIFICAGIMLNKKYGHYVEEGEPLGYLLHTHAPYDRKVDEARKEFQDAFIVDSRRVKEINLVKEIIL